MLRPNPRKDSSSSPLIWKNINILTQEALADTFINTVYDDGNEKGISCLHQVQLKTQS